MNPFAFHRLDLPVANSMLQVAAKIKLERPELEVIPRFMCLWVSFNNIYTRLWYECRSRQTGSTQSTAAFPCSEDPAITLFPTRPRERDQLKHAFAHFSPSLNSSLVLHPSTTFFARRRTTIPRAARNVPGYPRSNGVLNVGFSTATTPVYSAIDRPALQRFRRDRTLDHDRDLVASQVNELVYTVRNNIFHGGKDASSSAAINVTTNALTLLQLIIDDFVR